jgi:hypothetical protein
MQISGREYSKATVGLRQPKKITDQQFKLVFIYPLLIDTNLSKYRDLIRLFISASMLKELHISNSLNIIKMASSISPLIDEMGNIVDVGGNVSDEDAVSGYVKKETQQSVKYDIERRVEEKTEYIKKLINTDPQLKQYNPIIQFLTLNNFLDVPVIIGTKQFEIQSYVFLFLFTIAIASKGNMSMTSYSDIERMFKIIKNMRTNDVNILLNNLIDVPNKDVFTRIGDWFSKHPAVGRQLKVRWFPKTQKKIGQTLTTTGRRLKPLRQDDLSRQSLSDREINYPRVSSDLAGGILDLAQNDVQMASIFFKLAMDPDLMASQFGYDKSKGQLKETFNRINPKIKEVFNNAELYFTSNLWSNHIAPTLSSFLYTIIPTTSGINVSDLIIAIQNGDATKNIKPLMSPLIDFLKGDFRTTLDSLLEKKGPEKADEILGNMKSICQNYFEPSQRILQGFESMIDDRLTGPDFTDNDFISYEKQFEQNITTISSFTSTIDRALRDVFPNSVVNSLMTTKTSQIINDSLNSIIAYLATFQDYPSSTSFVVTLNIPQDKQSNEISNYISESKKQLLFYIRFMFLETIIYLLCQYVKETKVEIETTKHDVMDSNNYTIVTSVENIFAVANAFAAKSYKDLVNKSNREEEGNFNSKLMRDINNNYVKGVITYMHKQLDVPNLIVIDEKKQEVYYKLMYQSNVYKIKLNTMKTYAESVLK